jgi:hypothetical protein
MSDNNKRDERGTPISATVRVDHDLNTGTVLVTTAADGRIIGHFRPSTTAGQGNGRNAE